MSKLTHIDETGRARMVDVSGKADTVREAVATGFIRMSDATLSLALAGEGKKGDVRAVAEIAGVMAAKKTADLIPMCHPLPLTHVDVQAEIAQDGVHITATAATMAETGVEMEALTAAAVAALTVYDMTKALDKGIVIRSVRLEAKTGGKSGDWKRQGPGATD